MGVHTGAHGYTDKESQQMTKPLAYTNEVLTDIEQRLKKGWHVRRDEYETLIAMARERNDLTTGANSKPAAPTPMMM